MADQVANPDAAVDVPENAAPITPPPKVDPVEAPEAIPVAKFREAQAALEQERAERAALASRLQELEAEAAQRAQAQEEARLAAAKEQGKFKELYEEREASLAALRAELDQKAAALSTYEEREQARLTAKREANTERLAKLPEALQQLAPPGLEDEPDAMAAWIAKAETMPAAQTPVGGGERNPSPRQPAVKLTDAQAEIAKTYGFNPSDDKDRRFFLDTIWPRLGRKNARPAAEA